MKIDQFYVVTGGKIGICLMHKYGNQCCYGVTEKMVKLTKEGYTVCLDCLGFQNI